MINTLIFSKDRACQLELLLRSIKDNFKELTDITILYLPTNNDYEKGYDKLKEEYKDINWVFESAFVSQTKEIVNGFDKQFFLNFVDDEVVIRDTPIDNMLKALKADSKIHCGSLRLDPNMNYCYTANLPMEIPKDLIYNSQLQLYRWNWNLGDKRVDWYYPSCINSHVYLLSFAKWFINNIDFDCVNNLEGMLNNQRKKFRPDMICLPKSKTINIANNLIQTGTNRHGNKVEYTTKSLNDKFLADSRISTENLYNIITNTPTFETDYLWINHSKS